MLLAETTTPALRLTVDGALDVSDVASLTDVELVAHLDDATRRIREGKRNRSSLFYVDAKTAWTVLDAELRGRRAAVLVEQTRLVAAAHREHAADARLARAVAPVQLDEVLEPAPAVRASRLADVFAGPSDEEW